MELTALQHIRIVLMHTSHPGNIGAAARAMKTMGLHRLYLVNPAKFPDSQAEAMACGAFDLLQSAQVCASLDQALAGTAFALAVTARSRELAHQALDARQSAITLTQYAQANEVALVFGTEMSGLSNEDVLKCQGITHIPTNPDYSSLNLAAAVQVMAYELRMAAGGREIPPGAQFTPADFDEHERFYANLETTLVEIGYLDPHNPRRLMPRLRRLFARARLEHEEIQILHGVLRAINLKTRAD